MSVSGAGRARPSAPYNSEHRKQLVRVRLPRPILRRDGDGNPLRDARGRTSRITDGDANLDVTTLQPNGMILAFHEKGGEGSSMINIRELPAREQEKIRRAAAAARKREKKAPRDGRVYQLNPDATPVPGEVAAKFKYKSSKGKPTGQFADFFEHYGDGTQVGTWTTPGNGTTGAGGIRTILEKGDKFHRARVRPVTVRDADPKDGVDGRATFVYGYVVRKDAQGKKTKQYMWTIANASWWQTDRRGRRTGSVEQRQNLVVIRP